MARPWVQPFVGVEGVVELDLASSDLDLDLEPVPEPGSSDGVVGLDTRYRFLLLPHYQRWHYVRQCVDSTEVHQKSLTIRSSWSIRSPQPGRTTWKVPMG